MAQHERSTAYYHLPGLFEFYELYRVFLPLFREHREYFYDWCEIGSVYGAPADCIWGGGRTGFGDAQPHRVLALMQEYGISARLTFSNSLLREEHLADRKCNALCALFEKENRVQNGVIVHSDLLLNYLKRQYPGLYFVSSTTKVLTDFQQLRRETEREEFRYYRGKIVGGIYDDRLLVKKTRSALECMLAAASWSRWPSGCARAANGPSSTAANAAESSAPTGWRQTTIP